MIAEKGPDDPAVQAYAGKILLIARADVAMLLVVIVDMVARPWAEPRSSGMRDRGAFG